MSRQRPFTERLGFLIGSLVTAPLCPLVFLVALLAESNFDGRSLFTISMGLAIIGFLVFAALEFETDGLVSWITGGGVQRWRLGLGYVLGVSLKVLAVVHGVAALVFGSLLVWEADELRRALGSNPGTIVAIAFVVWLWLMTAVSYLAGDGWMSRSRRADRVELY